MAYIEIDSGIGEEPVAGETYKVYITGTDLNETYTCVSYECFEHGDIGLICIGDHDQQEYPFEIELGEDSCWMNTNLPAGTYHIKLERIKHDKIDIQYLPKVYCDSYNSWFSIVEALNLICQEGNIDLHFSEEASESGGGET